jgi:CRISPR-associated exonuclease Cas4
MTQTASPSFLEDPVPISALQHLLYCPRRCALIHNEGTFEENLYTLRGARVHEQAHAGGSEVVAGVRLEHALPLYSESLGLIGKADVVEFRGGVPYPVEYKAGARKKRNADDVQLCAQAMCLEEMLGVSIPEGSLFYDRSKRRRVVALTDELRERVRETVGRVRELFGQTALPEPVADERCRDCSLLDACLPHEVRNPSAPNPFAVEDP